MSDRQTDRQTDRVLRIRCARMCAYLLVWEGMGGGREGRNLKKGKQQEKEKGKKKGGGGRGKKEGAILD